MDERRKLERKYLTFFSRVIDRRNGQLIGYLADMTTGGAMLICDKPLEINQVLHMRIDLPEGYARETLDLNARVVWSQPEQDPDTFRTGLQLMNITPEEISLLGRLVAEFGFRG